MSSSQVQIKPSQTRVSKTQWKSRSKETSASPYPSSRSRVSDHVIEIGEFEFDGDEDDEDMVDFEAAQLEEAMQSNNDEKEPDRAYIEKKKAKGKSEFWNQYKRYLDVNDKIRVECIYCGKTFAVDLLKNDTRNLSKYVGDCLESPANKSKDFDHYLYEPRSSDKQDDMLGWWKLNELRFPILAHMARDILAIPVTTVPFESAFSTGGRTLDQFRSSLTPKTAQGIICTQDWLLTNARSDILQLEEEDPEEVFEEIEDGVEKIMTLSTLSITDKETHYIWHVLVIKGVILHIQTLLLNPL